MSLFTEFKEKLDDISPLFVYLEYDKTPLEDRATSFVTLGLDSEEFSYNLQGSSNKFAKSRIAFRIRIIMPKTVNPSTLDEYFNLHILKQIMQSDDYNIVSVDKETPKYTKYIDKMELSIKMIVDCITTFS